TFSGEQPPILDRSQFEAVQSQLDQQRTNYSKVRQQSQSLLMGRIFDEHGNRMTPSYAVKNGVRYRYYISTPLIQGQPNKAAKLKRIPAVEVETLIISTLRKRLEGASHGKEETERLRSLNDKELISSHVIHIEVKQDHLAVQLAPNSESLVIPWTKAAAKRP